MKNNSYIFTSESVSSGHPDKLADKISDSVLDEILTHDPNARVACETFCANKTIVLGGEITSNYLPNYEDIVRKAICEVGYDNDLAYLDGNKIEFINKLNTQSLDIKIGVDSSMDDPKDIGAGDQGLVFGYAINETKNYMPLAITLAHNLTEKQTNLFKGKLSHILNPDAKSQVSIQYQDNKAKHIDTIVLSTQHKENIHIEDLRKIVLNEIILPTIDNLLITPATKILINPTGRFVIGGPAGDCGLTGRKIIVDTYGGSCPHGGGAFSGKDPTKVDRSAAYYARYVAKNVVANNLATKCQIQVSYAIGVSRPVSIYVNTFNTETTSLSNIIELINSKFDFRPGNIIEELDLKRPIYKDTAAFGHFGRDNPNFTWEKIREI